MTANDKLGFVFLTDVGQPVVESVGIAEILAESRRQGWTRG
jgi:hypothetical protein